MYIIAIDIDGTIQGDITPQVEEYTLLNRLGMKYNTKELQEDYRKGLLRPYFVNFIEAYKSKAPSIELFIYTASEPGWAQTIVPVIEKVVDFRFNRPILHRSNCDMSQHKHKSIEMIAPHLLRSMRRKHKGMKITLGEIKKMTFLIDNNYILQENDHLLKCPSYERTVYIDPLRNLSNAQTIKHKKLIAAVLLERVYTKESIWQLMEEVYRSIRTKCKKSHSQNKHHKSDQFWKAVMWIFMKSETSTDIMRRMIHHFQLKNNSKTTE